MRNVYIVVTLTIFMAMNCQLCLDDFMYRKYRLNEDIDNSVIQPATVIVQAQLGHGSGALVTGATHLCDECHHLLRRQGNAWGAAKKI